MGRSRSLNCEHLFHIEGKDGVRSETNFQHIIRNNFAADCSISFKFGTEFDHVTPDVQTSKVKGSEVKVQRDVTYQQ